MMRNVFHWGDVRDKFVIMVQEYKQKDMVSSVTAMMLLDIPENIAGNVDTW